jgi:plastocyanin
MRIARIVALCGLAVLALAACGGGTVATTAPAAPTSAPAASPGGGGGGSAVTISGSQFQPASVTVAAQTAVTWTNNDQIPHTVKWDDGTPESPELTQGGDPYERTFDAPGTFSYVCGIHSNMTGSVTVTQ